MAGKWRSKTSMQDTYKLSTTQQGNKKPDSNRAKKLEGCHFVQRHRLCLAPADSQLFMKQLQWQREVFRWADQSTCQCTRSPTVVGHDGLAVALIIIIADGGNHAWP